MDDRTLILNQYNKPVRCDKCGGDMVFKGVGEYTCERCGFLAYDDYGKVRNYIEEHHNATTAEISLATGVSQREINDMLREERFDISNDSKVFLKCQGCGKDIKTGRYCVMCAKLAEAAEIRKKKKEMASSHSKNIQGISTEYQSSDAGAKRFTRDK